MINIGALKYLASQKRKDAETLFRLKRNNGAVYLMGYALEPGKSLQNTAIFKYQSYQLYAGSQAYS